jgi:hypothetical protein
VQLTGRGFKKNPQPSEGAVTGHDRLRNCLTVLGLTALLGASAQVTFAHHSLGGEFDTRKTLKLIGVVSHVDWANPHIYVNLAVTDASGKVSTWRLECVPVAMARKAGVNMKMLQGNGDRVTVDAYPARDGTPQLGFLARITYPDGHHFQFAQDTAAEGK